MNRVACKVVGLLWLMVAGLAHGQTAPDQLLQKIISNQATKADMVAAFSTHKIADLSTAASFAVRARGNPEIVDFIREVWRDDSKKYPSLAWNEIKHPRVRVSLAQTLGQIDKQSPEYYEYIKSALQSNQELVRANAALALGIVGSDRDIPTLSSLSKGQSLIVSIHAIQGLGALGTEQSREVLAKLKSEVGQSPEKQDAIQSALEMK